jgi:predicted nucleotidyltransferase
MMTDAVSVPLGVQRTLARQPRLLELLVQTAFHLARSPFVLGIVVSGSIAAGTADEFSDVDLLAITSDEGLLPVWDDRMRLERALGHVAFRFDLTEYVPFSAAAYFNDGSKIHVTYRAVGKLQPDLEYRRADPLVIRTRVITEWLDACRTLASRPRHDVIVRADEQFWFWLQQGASKIGRGELWAAYDTLHVLRALVLSAICTLAEIPFEGFRHVETRLDAASLRRMNETIAGLDQAALADAYRHILEAYMAARAEIEERFDLLWSVPSDAIVFAQAKLTEWTGGPARATPADEEREVRA